MIHADFHAYNYIPKVANTVKPKVSPGHQVLAIRLGNPKAAALIVVRPSVLVTVKR